MMPVMTSEAADSLLHCLGMKPERPETRNYFVCGEAEAEILELVNLGFLEEKRRPGHLDIRDHLFVATPAGKAAAAQWLEDERQRQPKIPYRRRVGKERYRIWLQLSDCWPDMKFGEFLKRKLYSEEVRADMLSKTPPVSMWA